MSESKPRSLWRLVALVVVLQVWLGLMLASIYLSAHNSLYNNGNWTSIKTTLDGNLMGAQNYVFNLQALAGGRLGVSAWHGYQEVISKRELDPASVEFDFLLKPHSHLTFEFNRTERRFRGIRLSAAELFPPVLLQATADGRFLRKRALEELAPAALPKWHRLKVVFDEKRLSVFLDRRKVKTLRSGVLRPQRIGFRGSMRPVYVDNVRVVSRDGSVFRDSFSRPGNWLLVNLLAVGAIVLAGTLLYLLMRRLLPIDEKYLLFYFLMFTALLLILSSLWLGVNWHKKKFYPNATEKMRRIEEGHIETGSERMIERIESGHTAEPEPGIARILFVGSSQTRGSGAARPAQTLVRQTERLLNQRAGERRFECLNVAVRGYRISQMVRDFNERWIGWSPDVVIVNAGNNDQAIAPDRWERALTGIIEPAREAGIRVVLIPEANSVERRSRGLRRLHQTSRELGARIDLPVIDMQGHLERRSDDGFLWWDWVHLTSFGQQVFAEHLVDELLRLGVVEIEPAPG